MDFNSVGGVKGTYDNSNPGAGGLGSITPNLSDKTNNA